MYSSNTIATIIQSVLSIPLGALPFLWAFVVCVSVARRNRRRHIINAKSTFTICIGISIANMGMIISASSLVIPILLNPQYIGRAADEYDAGTLRCQCPSCAGNSTSELYFNVGEQSCWPYVDNSAIAFVHNNAFPYSYCVYTLLEDLTIIRIFSAIYNGNRFSTSGVLAKRLARLNFLFVFFGSFIGTMFWLLWPTGIPLSRPVIFLVFLLSSVFSCPLCLYGYISLPRDKVDLKRLMLKFLFMRMSDLISLTSFVIAAYYSTPIDGASCYLYDSSSNPLVGCYPVSVGYSRALIAAVLPQFLAAIAQLFVVEQCYRMARESTAISPSDRTTAVVAPQVSIKVTSSKVPAQIAPINTSEQETKR